MWGQEPQRVANAGSHLALEPLIAVNIFEERLIPSLNLHPSLHQLLWLTWV